MRGALSVILIALCLGMRMSQCSFISLASAHKYEFNLKRASSEGVFEMFSIRFRPEAR